ncbi:MAG: shikimate kinase [Oscillibacter sp.]|nr:shikimate kinase [Oscillibacter sp.]
MTEKLYGLLGRKLGHSWSAPIHHALGCESYRLIELEPEELGAFLAREDIGGLNVTIPYKRSVIPFCDVLDPLARAIGSVNTIVRQGTKLYGSNTDAAGLLYMAKRAGISFAGKKVVVLGSGGASLTAQAVARTESAREVIVVSRSGETNYETLPLHADADILINATPVGMYPRCGEAPVDLGVFSHLSGVLDLIYNPRRTALLLQAELLGIPCSDGLPMLVAQAVAAEEHFFEKAIPVEKAEAILSTLRSDMTNIVLIGMPGSGKTTVGDALAALTGREALDVDREIVRRTGRSIPDIFREDGEAAFRALERQVTAELGAMSGKIILTGGGVVKDLHNYASLRQNGRIYHLWRSLEVLPVEGRPLSQGSGAEKLWAERKPLYEAFRDVLIDNNDTVSAAADAIWRDFCENSGA